MPTTRHSILPDEPRAMPSYWHNDTLGEELPPQEPPDAVEIAVIGGGLLGSSTAYWLARAGKSVALFEARTLAAGATGRNGGFMVEGTAASYLEAIALHGHDAARAVWALTHENRAMLRQLLADESIDCDYREVGDLRLALSAEEYERQQRIIAALHADGWQAELLDRAQTQEHIGVELGPSIVGSVFVRENGLLHSARFVHGLANAAQRHGAQIFQRQPVLKIEQSTAGLRLHLPERTVTAQAVVIAVNAWSDLLVRELHNLIIPVRGQVLAYAPIRPVFRCGMHATFMPTGEYWQQTPDGTIVLGGCRAIALNQDVGVRQAVPTREVQAAIEHVLPQLFPALSNELRVVQRWAGLMAFTSDASPIADRVPGLDNAWVVGGFSGHGMPFGLRLGQLLAEAVQLGERPHELEPFRLDRPTLKPLAP